MYTAGFNKRQLDLMQAGAGIILRVVQGSDRALTFECFRLATCDSNFGTMMRSLGNNWDDMVSNIANTFRDMAQASVKGACLLSGLDIRVIAAGLSILGTLSDVDIAAIREAREEVPGFTDSEIENVILTLKNIVLSAEVAEAKKPQDMDEEGIKEFLKGLVEQGAPDKDVVQKLNSLFDSDD